MTIVNELQRIKDNISNSYTALAAKGVELPAIQNSNNLASTISSLEVGGGSDELLKEYIEGTITEVVLPSDITSIRQSAFYVSTSTTSQNFRTATLTKLEGEGIKEVGRTAVYGQTNLTTIKLPNCTKIGYQGLMINNNSSNSLSDITLGAIEEIADYGLQRVFLNSNQTRNFSFNNCAVGSNAFDGNSFEELDLTGVKSLGQSSF